MGKCVRSLKKVATVGAGYAHSKSTCQFLRLSRNYRNRIQIEQNKNNRDPDEQGPDKGGQNQISESKLTYFFTLDRRERSENS